MLLNIHGVWDSLVYLLDVRNYRRRSDRLTVLALSGSRGAWVGACVAPCTSGSIICWGVGYAMDNLRRWTERGDSSRAPCVDCT
ncbi:hypothetical protein BD310DRAFT_938198 [Dichomitus squalens]|uniref:Uncharacterized protein n=1 Tax=Dichomitus squalens TaxID=114155 RepID=A0A4Q9PF15_9APHY|nr:hypothetical protein BD310DRAFT_938198 [Dichomitus squalens]